MSTTRIMVVLAAAAWSGLTASSAARADCIGRKLVAIGKKEARRLACQARVAATNDSSGLSLCEAAASGKFSTSFDSAGVCAGDTGVCEAVADSCETTLSSAMTEMFPSRCEARKRKAAGKLAQRELYCYAKPATGAVADADCIAKARDKFATALTKAGTCPDGGAPQVQVESNCVQPAVMDDFAGNAIMICTSTTTSTTTTTIPPSPCSPDSCGNPCDALCGSSVCAPTLGGCGYQHLGSGDACIDAPSCFPANCSSDADCSAGQVCIMFNGGPYVGDYAECCSTTATTCSDTCTVSQAPTCGGTCPSGYTCGQASGRNTCTCVTADATCLISEAPACGGTCPSGRVCGQASGGNSCECVTADQTCLISEVPACGGTCPSPFVCGQTSEGNSCECVCEQTFCTFITKWGSPGSGDGQFQNPTGVAVDASGNVFVADDFNDRIQKFDNQGTFLAKWGTTGSGDGQFYRALDVAVDSRGNIFVSDSGNDRIQKFDQNGAFLTKWGSFGTGAGQFYQTAGLAVDATGNVFVADVNENRIQKFTNTGTFLLAFGWGVADGNATLETCTSACQGGGQGTGDGQFTNPMDVGVDASGDVFVADWGNDRIQKFDNNGIFLTKWGSAGSGDGQFNGPDRIAVDSAGNVFVSDASNNRIQKFDTNGTFLAKWGCVGSGDGEFMDAEGLAVDGSGNVFAGDANQRIQKFACP